MRKGLVFLAALAALAVLAGSAMAGSLPAAGSGSISLGTVDGQRSAATGVARYQSQVVFATTGASTLKNPRIWVTCYQNDVRVYAEGGAPSSTFKLGGDMSQWVLNGGGNATCTADLYYILNAKGTAEWNGHGGQGGNVYLGSGKFSASS